MIFTLGPLALNIVASHVHTTYPPPLQVETKCGLLSEAESQLYHSLHPIAGGTATDATTAGNVLRHRSAAGLDAPAQRPTLSSQDHLKIWEWCGFHFCVSVGISCVKIEAMMGVYLARCCFLFADAKAF